MAQQHTLDAGALDLILRKAHSLTAWQKKEVSDDLLRQVYDLAKMGPTSANCCPMRIVFIRSKAAKEKLKGALVAGNVDKTMTAPVTAVFAHDLEFYEKLPKLFPHVDAKSWFVGNKPLIEETAFRNGTLQMAYFMIAARSLGLDCGPMSGFDKKKVNELFFSGTSHQANFLCNIGYGDPASLHPRSPRMDFEEVCKVI